MKIHGHRPLIVHFSYLIFSIVLLAFFNLSPAYGQGQTTTSEKQITGKVADMHGQPLEKVSVSVKGRSGSGTTTDANGVFSIAAAPQDILVFSYVGYESYEVKAGTGGLSQVILNTSGSNMSEVVIVGYGTVKRQDLTGAIASVKGADLKTQGVSDVTRSLQGKMAGVTIESAGGDPGSGTRILIRGVGSIGGNGSAGSGPTTSSNPLYLVDGVPVAGINYLSSTDIESIDVLKDASAAAIYGSRAANGVVLVTTKMGKSGKPAIEFDVNEGQQKLVHKLDVLNAQEWATVSNASHDAAGLPRLAIANPVPTGPGTDWQNAIYRTGAIQQYQLSVTGGSESTKYGISGGYNDQQGIVDVTGYKRYNLRARTETTKGRFKFGETVFLSREKWITMPGGWGGQGGNPVGSAAKMIPVFQIYDSTALGGFSGASGPVVNVANPVAQLHLENINRVLTSIVTNAFGELTLLPSLKYRFSLGYTNSFTSSEDYWKRYNVGTLFAHPTNDLNDSKDQTTLVLLENTLHFDKTFGKHSIQALAGYTYQQTNYSYWAFGKTDLPDGIEVLDAGAGAASSGGNTTQSDLVSLLGRAIYSYDNRYLLTASLRRDGSSRFGSANRYGSFPSVAVGWNVSNEQFFRQFDNQLSSLKFRASYGVLGNQEIGDYQYSAAIASNINYVSGDNQQKWFGAIQTAFASPNIKWENTVTENVGLDLGLFKNKLTLTADYFVKQTNDVLLNVPIPGSAGSTSNPVVNAGTLRNNGIEIGFNFNDHAGKLNYNVFGTFTAIKNKVIQLGTGTQQIFGGQPTHHGASTTVTQAGGPVSAFYLVQTAGLFQTQAEVNAYSKNGTLVQPNASPGDIKFVDANGDGQISDADRVYCGSPFPKFEFGFGASANMYNFDLNIYFQGTYGNKIYNGLRQDLESMSLEFNYAKSTLNAWTPQKNSSIPRAVDNDPNFNDRSSARFLEDGSYLRMKTLQLGYRLPESAARKMTFSSMRAYISADNLFTITSYSGYNPDIGRTGSILDRGVDFGHIAYPLARTISIGIQLGL